MFRVKESNRWPVSPLVCLVGLLVAGDLAATPPKSTGPGTAVSERESKEERPAQRGVSPSAWLDALSRQSVTAAQQDVMTPIVREFLHRSAVWSRDVDPRYRAMLQTYREADAESRPAMLVQIKALRSERPQFQPVKARLWALLDNTQQVRLLQTIRTQSTPSRLTRPSARKAARSEPGPARDAAVRPPAGNGSSERADEPPRLWQFGEDENPARHVDPSKPASKTDPADESEAVSPEGTPGPGGDAD